MGNNRISMESPFIVCETTATITLHARRVDAAPIQLGGHSTRVLALCGRKIAWDTRLPLSAVRCVKCQAEIAKIGPQP